MRAWRASAAALACQHSHHFPTWLWNIGGQFQSAGTTERATKGRLGPSATERSAQGVCSSDGRAPPGAELARGGRRSRARARPLGGGFECPRRGVRASERLSSRRVLVVPAAASAGSVLAPEREDGPVSAGVLEKAQDSPRGLGATEAAPSSRVGGWGGATDGTAAQPHCPFSPQNANNGVDPRPSTRPSIPEPSHASMHPSTYPPIHLVCLLSPAHVSAPILQRLPCLCLHPCAQHWVLIICPNHSFIHTINIC